MGRRREKVSCFQVLCHAPQVTVQGPVPVRAAEIVVDVPAQMVALPETVAVGLALTVTTALPLEVPPTQALASEMATTV